MSAPSKRGGPDGQEMSTVLLWAGMGLIIVVLAVTNAGVVFGHRLAGLPPLETWQPFNVAFGVFRGTVDWPLQSWLVAGGVVIVLGILGLMGWFVFGRTGGRSPVDRAARFMGTGMAIEGIQLKAVREKARRLGVQGDSIGVFLGVSVDGGKRLYTSWEDVAVIIAGPRTGKTTSQVIPAIADAPGAVVTTSNKRDVVDATRALRAETGNTWVFDPQGLADEQPTWWWNPLSYIHNEVSALRLAKLFADASRQPGERRDPFFDGSAETLLGGLLLAARRHNAPLSIVSTWLKETDNDLAVEILQNSGDLGSASAVSQIISAPERQKGGVYGTAQNMMSFLNNTDALRWVEAGDGKRPEFSPHDFVRSRDTLYSLSKEGSGSTGPIVTALTVAVTEAAEEFAKLHPGGRLSTPLVLVLDEAANVCRWNDLPDLYSHYGSRGISIFTILQSWSQGVEVWGESGMKKLWTAANAKLYLGGVDETQFLADMSQLVGEFERNSRSVSYSPGGTSNSHQARTERILDPSDLRALPRGRAILLYSGLPAVLMRTVPWMVGPHAEAIKTALAVPIHPATVPATEGQAA